MNVFDIAENSTFLETVCEETGNRKSKRKSWIFFVGEAVTNQNLEDNVR